MSFIRNSLVMGPTIVGVFKVVRKYTGLEVGSYLIESKLKDYLEDSLFEGKEVKDYKYKIKVRNGNDLSLGGKYFIVAHIEPKPYTSKKNPNIHSIQLTASACIRCRKESSSLRPIHQILTLPENIITFEEEEINRLVELKQSKVHPMMFDKMSLHLHNHMTPYLIRTLVKSGPKLNIKQFGAEYDWSILRKHSLFSIDAYFRLDSRAFSNCFNKMKGAGLKTPQQLKQIYSKTSSEDFKPNRVSEKTELYDEQLSEMIEEVYISVRATAVNEIINLSLIKKVSEDTLNQWDTLLTEVKDKGSEHYDDRQFYYSSIERVNNPNKKFTSAIHSTC